jgi:hypothetical protein
VIWNQIEEEEDEKGRHVHLGVCVIRIWRGIQTGDPSSRFWFLGLTKRSRAGDAYIFIFNTHINFWFASFSFYLFKNFNDLIRLLAERAQIAQSSRFDLRDFSIFIIKSYYFLFFCVMEGWGGFPSAISSIQKRQRMRRVPSGTVQISFIYFFPGEFGSFFFCCSMPDPSSESSCDVLHKTQNP